MADDEKEVRAELFAAHLNVARAVHEARGVLVLALVLFERLIHWRRGYEFVRMLVELSDAGLFEQRVDLRGLPEAPQAAQT